MSDIRFGPSGNSQIFFDAGFKYSIEAPSFLAKYGLKAYEYSFGRGFTLSEEKAKILGQNAKLHDVEVSLHAPYYINFANENEDMIFKSFSYITRCLDYIKLMNCKKIVIHLASCGKMTRENALILTKKRLEECVELCYKHTDMSNAKLCPETMGRYSQIGDEKEIVDFCIIDKCLTPTFDFGHINSLKQGGLKTVDDYKRIFDYSFEKLGEEKTKNCHIHFSKIQYGLKGEIKHLSFEDNNFGPDFETLAKVLIEYKLTSTVICESGNTMMEDAIKMKNIYDKLKLKNS